MFFLGKIDDMTTSFTPRSMLDLPMLIISPVSFSVFIISFVRLYISLEPICSKTRSGWSSWKVGRIWWFNLLDVAPRKILKYIFLPLTDFWKICLFILFKWLSPMTQIFFPNLVASTYVLLPGIIRAFLCARGSYWLLVILASGCLLCLVHCFFCLFLPGAWSNEDDIDFSSSLSSGLSWHSSMGRISNEFLNGILESCWWFSLIFLFLPVPLTVMKFSLLSLALWAFICWTDNNSVIWVRICNNSICCLIYSVCTVSCPVTFSHNRRSILSILSAVLALNSR